MYVLNKKDFFISPTPKKGELAISFQIACDL